jgi:hypothetical protein
LRHSGPAPRRDTLRARIRGAFNPGKTGKKDGAPAGAEAVHGIVRRQHGDDHDDTRAVRCFIGETREAAAAGEARE